MALLGGVLQVLLTMLLAGGVASAIGASIQEGVFIGALVRLHHWRLHVALPWLCGALTSCMHILAEVVLLPCHVGVLDAQAKPTSMVAAGVNV